MTPQETFERYRDLVVVNGDRIAHEMSYAFRQLSEEQQAQLHVNSATAGNFWLFRPAPDHKHAGMVLEVVYSIEAGDCIQAIYRDNRINASAGELIRARENLIRAIAERRGLSIERCGVDDAGRGRMIGLEEMTTGQLIDMLAEEFNGKSILTLDNRVGNMSLMDKMMAKLRLSK